MILRELMMQAQARLRDANIENPGRDVRKLVAAALAVPAERLTLISGSTASPDQVAQFEAYVSQRLARKPVARILGYREFWGRKFEISADVLDPRADTETIVLEALKTPAKRLLDLGTGSGVLAVTLVAEWPDAQAVASDISNAALAIAKTNAAAHGVAGRVEFCCSDWFAAISGQFDLIVSNPPYISESEFPELSADVTHYDPKIALSPGKDGLAAYRTIARDAHNHLLPSGRLIVEIGASQGAAVKKIFTQIGYQEIEILKDLSERDRVVTAKMPD
ncbi:peptide chain release factor N(5)-glutamine methyltransferase [Rhodobacteraceae bacterium Araon29]